MPSLRRTASMVAVSFVVAGCWMGQPGGSALPTATPGAPPSLGLPSPLPSGDLAGCPNFVEVVETGPVPGDDGTEEGPVGREQRRLEADIEAVLAYAAGHTDEYASIRYENGPRVRIVVGFTANIAEHCSALRAILEYPEEFEIIRQPATEAQLEQIQEELSVTYRDKLRGVGRGAGVIHLALRADGEAEAAEVLAAYGELVEITVGALPYPDPFALPASCGLPEPILIETPFAVTATIDPDTVRSGRDFGGTVTVTNTGSVPATLDTGQPATAIVFRAGSNRAVGVYTGAIAGTGYGGTLAPGEALDIDVLGGTASCDPALGYALPPGSYDVRVVVDAYTMHESAPTEFAYLLSEPVALTIVP